MLKKIFYLCMVIFIIICIVNNENQECPAKFLTNQYIKNGNFSAGMKNWEFYHHDGGSSTYKIKDGKLNIHINDRGNVPWSVVLLQQFFKLTKGHKYKVSFTASSSVPVGISVMTMNGVAPYNNFSGRYHFQLKQKLQEYSFIYTMWDSSYEKCALQFQLGKNNRDKKNCIIIIGSVKVSLVGLKDKLFIPKGIPGRNRKNFKRGITFGNTLEAPVEGHWSPEIKKEYFGLIASQKIFDHVRIPINWESHSLEESPYTINGEFFKRIEWVVANVLKHKMYAVINMHHQREFENHPRDQKEKFLILWKQIAEKFKKYPQQLYFEIYNEPGSKEWHNRYYNLNNPDIWNELYVQAYHVIRKISPRRKIIITVPSWASIDKINELKIPADIQKDPNIIVQFHFYHPADFCFQGTMGNGKDNVSGVRWTGTKSEKQEIIERLDNAVKWGKVHNNVKLWNGEFTAHSAESLPEDRLKWIRFIIQECEKRNISWCYWDFAGDTSRIYNPGNKTWNNDILNLFKKK